MAPAIDSSLSPSIQAAVDRINEFGPYGYRPNLAANIIFCVVWAILTLILSHQGISHRRWWLLATLAAGTLLECVGDAIRIYGHFQPVVVNAYIAQQCILVLTPAFFAAAHFTILTKICKMFDSYFIRPFRPNWLIPFFVILDVASLAVQGAGSAISAISEINGENVGTVNSHGQVVTAGLAIQLAGYVGFNIIFLLFILRASRQQKANNNSNKLWNSKTKLFLLATWISALLVLGRSIFRTAEMGKGWIGVVATTEWYYLTFDATFVVLAVIILIVVSPTKYLPRSDEDVLLDDASGLVVSSQHHQHQDIEGQNYIASHRGSSVSSSPGIDGEKASL